MDAVQDYINKAQSNPVDFIRALISVAQAPGQQQAQASSLDAQDKTAQTRNAYQMGAEKALKEHGYNQAKEALQQGVDPNAIVNHSVMQQQNIIPETPAGDIRPIVVNGQNQPTTNNSDTLNILSSLINKQNPAPQQNFGYQPDNAVSKFFNMLGIQPSPDAQVQLTQAAMNRQRIAAGQPAEIALPAAQASGLLQEQAGQKPIQPYEAAQLRAGQNTAQITAMQDSINNLQKRRDALNTEFENEGKTISAIGKLGGLLTFQGQQMTPRQKAIKVEQSGIDRVLAKMQSKLSGYSPENPAALKGNTSSIPEGRVSVISPDGVVGHIPQSQLNEAIKAGYKRN